MSFAIVVLNYNDHENTKKYIESVKDYNIIDKIIVVDNNSTTKDEIRILKELESEKVEVLSAEKNGGYAYGNNLGLKYLEKIGNYEFVAISNPDVFVDEETLEECLKYLKEHNKVAIVAPRMHFVSGPARRAAWKKRTPIIDIANSTRLTETILFPIFKKGEYSKKEYEIEDLKVDCIAGSFFVAKYDSLKKVNYLDEGTFLFYEEDILGEKLRRIGLEIHLLNNLKFMHYDSQTIGKLMNLFRKQDILFDSKIYYHKKYNNAKIAIVILRILRYVRKFELLFEVPIRKIVQAKNNK